MIPAMGTVARVAVCATAAVAMVTAAAATDSGPMRVGTEQYEQYGSPHPYPPSSSSQTPVWSDTLHVPGATYIAPHFARLDLGPGDRVVVRSPDGSRMRVYTGTGKGVLGRSPDGFWGIHIEGDTALIELFSSPSGGGYGYEIDRLARGLENVSETSSRTRSVCGADDSDWAPCYAGAHPEITEHSRAVARLLVNGTIACTGWLLGCSGHVMTTQQCILDELDAANTDFELMAEGDTCDTDCSGPLFCPGTIEADTSALIRSSWDLDYSLVRLPVNPSTSYGFLRLRLAGAVVDERIYIPQHPNLYGKRIALSSTAPADESGVAEIFSVAMTPCTGGTGDTGYFADTTEGSSGAPVIAVDDNRVVALHHCGSCPNRGVPIGAIIKDLGDDLPPCSIGIGCEPSFAGIGALQETSGALQGMSLSWDAATSCAGLGIHYRVFHGPTADGVDWYAPVAWTESTSIDLYGMAPSVEHCFGVRAYEGDEADHDFNTTVLCRTGTAVYVAGDTDVDSDVDTDDLDQLVAVLFGAPDMGSGVVAADVDASGAVDAGDSATEIGYLNDTF